MFKTADPPNNYFVLLLGLPIICFLMSFDHLLLLIVSVKKRLARKPRIIVLLCFGKLELEHRVLSWNLGVLES